MLGPSPGVESRRVRHAPALSRLHIGRVVLIAGLAQLLLAGGAMAASATLAWDPSPTAGVSEYRVYVGVSPGQYSQWYDVPASQNSFVVGQLTEGTRYYFAVSSKAGSVVGPRSEEVSGLPSPDADFVEPPYFEQSYSPRVAPSSCQGSQVCPTVTALGTVLGAVSALAALPDGRVLVVEDGRRIRLARAGAVDEAPAAQVSQAAARISALALDPRFAATHLVLVGETRTTERGRLLDVVRYRELNGILGEPAVVVVGLRLEGSGDVHLAMDEQGDIFVASPGPTPAVAGSLLRFGIDGSVPRDNPRSSPTVGAGPAMPRALAAVGGGMLWSIDGAGQGQSFSVGAATRGGAPSAAGAQVAGRRAGPPSMDGLVVGAAIGAIPTGESFPVYLVSNAGRLWRGTTDDNRFAPVETGSAEGEHVVAVSVDASGALYVAIRPANAADGDAPYRILRLAR